MSEAGTAPCASGPRTRLRYRSTTRRTYSLPLLAYFLHSCELICVEDRHKSLAYTRPDGNVTATGFAWVPSGSASDLATYFDTHPGVEPTHISFGVSLWLANDPPAVYVAKVRPALAYLTAKFPLARISVRTSAGVVQAIVSQPLLVWHGPLTHTCCQACYDRIGGQRRQMEANNAALLERGLTQCLCVCLDPANQLLPVSVT